MGVALHKTYATMKLKITRTFCVFLLIIATLAFGALLVMMSGVGSEPLASNVLLTFGGCAAVTVGYAVLLLNNWTNADKLLVFAGIYAVILLLLLNTLGLT